MTDVPGTPRPAAPLFHLGGRVALVTGAASGLGRAIAVGLAAHGAAVFATDIDATGLAATIDAVQAAGGRADGTLCDVSDEAAVATAFAALDASMGRIDILVNDAFTPVVRATPEAFPLDAWQRSLAVNLTGYFLCAREAGRRMIAQGAGGSIINISSIAGSSALGRGNLVYSVSKHGVNGLTRELAIEWARHGIRVNAIAPSQFLTPAVRTWIDGSPDPDALRVQLLLGIPLDRIGDPDRDIVGPVVFLASDAAAMITGTLLPVDGGNLAFNAGGSKTW